MKCDYSADLIWRMKMPGFAPAIKGDRSFSAFFPPHFLRGLGRKKGENVDFPNAAE